METLMNRIWMSLMFLVPILLFVPACGDDSAGEEIEDAADEVEDTVEDVADEIEDEM